MAHGGARIGAGKKKGTKASHTLEAQEVKKIYIELAREHGLPVAMALLAKALDGDIPAIKEFNDRAFGKAMQAIEMSGKDGEPLLDASPTLIQLAQKLDELRKHS